MESWRRRNPDPTQLNLIQSASENVVLCFKATKGGQQGRSATSLTMLFHSYYYIYLRTENFAYSNETALLKSEVISITDTPLVAL